MLDLAAGILHRTDIEHLRVDRAVLALVPDFAAPFALVLQRFPEIRVEVLGHAAGFQDGRRLAAYFVERVARRVSKGLVDHLDAALRVGDRDALKRVLEHDARQALRADEFLRLAEHEVEGVRCLPDLIVAGAGQGARVLDLAAGDVIEAGRQLAQGARNDPHRQVPDEEAKRQHEKKRGQHRVFGKGLHRLFGTVERDLHRHGAQDGAKRHFMAAQAVLAQIVLDRNGRKDRLEAFLGMAVPSATDDPGDRRPARKHADFLEVRGHLAGLADAKLVDHGTRAIDAQFANVVRLPDLVQEDFALGHCVGDHHAGQAGHGHLVNALREVVGLAHRELFLLLAGPVKEARPHGDQGGDDGGDQPDPDAVIVEPGKKSGRGGNGHSFLVFTVVRWPILSESS